MKGAKIFKALTSEIDFFKSHPRDMRTVLLTNMIYALVLPIVDIFVGAYIMRSSNDQTMVAVYQLAVYTGIPITFFINGKDLLAKVFWMARNHLSKGDTVILKHTTQETPCTIVKISSKLNTATLENINTNMNCLENNEVGKVLLKAFRPIVWKDYSSFESFGKI